MRALCCAQGALPVAHDGGLGAARVRGRAARRARAGAPAVQEAQDHLRAHLRDALLVRLRFTLAQLAAYSYSYSYSYSFSLPASRAKCNTARFLLPTH